MTMQLGKGVKAEKAEKTLAKAGPLFAGETVWFYCKCSVDSLVVTNARVLAVSSAGAIPVSALVTEIDSSSYDPKRGTVHLTTNVGREVRFSAIPEQDVPSVQHYLEHARANPAPPEVLTAIAEASAAGGTLAKPFVSDRDARKGERQDARQAAKDERARARADQEAADLALG